MDSRRDRIWTLVQFSNYCSLSDNKVTAMATSYRMERRNTQASDKYLQIAIISWQVPMQRNYTTCLASPSGHDTACSVERKY